MIAAVIPIFVISLSNISHIILAIFFFPSIVEFLDDLYWGFTYRSWSPIARQLELGPNIYIHHSKVSILMDKADLYEKNQSRKDILNYYREEDKDFEQYLNFRENRKMLQQAFESGTLIRKQNYRARIHERMVEQPVTEKKELLRSR
ncbi:uncharacterized protein CELE_T05G5.4 [Caenorhabditis elegans]|uniref:Uncharacterized protein T05G5.4 n=1 Tax=Caenorhabditis elegans TaxID=6239 RepID=YNP4_CAEEL|nr:Uncharacterized protein CELE_T05G5.4 [Caenorhabditis elegans]P34557.2 RecName: Full=Uncharacterized protein T05G5.4 [Caenorhabditis elegans]CAA81591.2 Uncharacterized protein CELE_T05G5.4 [Caenorhabditis elegans]|eukprot:NP_499154.2 Uncharacterized protein CELE_T05G5.4 [Caenorhabditis elegans]